MVKIKISNSSNSNNDNDCQHATSENEEEYDNERLLLLKQKQTEKQQQQNQQQHYGLFCSHNKSNTDNWIPQRHQNQNQQLKYTSEQEPSIIISEDVERRRKRRMYRNNKNSCNISINIRNDDTVSKMIQRYYYYYPHHQCCTMRILLLLYIILVHIMTYTTVTVNGSIYSFFNTKNKRPTVRVVILAGEGNIEGFASISHLTELINDEYKKQQKQQQRKQHSSSQSKQKKQAASVNDYEDDNEEGSTIDVVIEDNNDKNEKEYNQNQFGPYSHLVDTYDNITGRVINWTIFDNVYVTYEHHHTTSTTTSASTVASTTTGTTGSTTTSSAGGTSSSSSSTPSVQIPQVDVLLYDTLSIMNTSKSIELANTESLLTGCRSCFGPEIQIGYLLQEYYNNNNNNDNQQIPIVVVKAGWHDRSMHRDWLNGYQLYRFINTLEKTIQQLPNILQTTTDSSSDSNTNNRKINKIKYKHPHIEYIGMVWWQGYSDMINGIYRSQYDVNLVSFVDKVRTTIKQPTLPIVIVELGISGTSNRLVPQMEYDIRFSQQNVCTVYQSSYVQLVSTSYIVDQYQLLHNDIDNDSDKIQNKYYHHPRNESQYYYGRADVLLDISYEIGITLIELNERRIEDKKFNWFHYKGSAATTSSLVQNNAIDGTISSNSNNNNEQQQEQDAEFDQVQETRITNSIVMVCIILLLFVVCVIIYNYYEIHCRSKSKLKTKLSSKNKLSSNSISTTNNNNQLSEFVKIFRPTLSTINEDDDMDNNNNNNNDQNDNDNDEQLLLLQFTKNSTDIELQQRAEQYGVQPQY